MMMIRWQRFNIYLLVTIGAAALCGCHSPARPSPSKLLSTLRLHLEVSRDATETTEPVPIYRAKPVRINVARRPFLTEAEVAEAKVIDASGDYALHLKFDRAGTTLLEQYTTAHRGRRIAVFSQFGEQLKDHRWLAAPVIARRITDGVLTFTPDATREEAEEIALGLNNVAKQTRSGWIDR